MVPRAPSGEKTAPSATSGTAGGTMFNTVPTAPFLAPAALAGDFAGDFVPFFGDYKMVRSFVLNKQIPWQTESLTTGFYQQYGYSLHSTI